jgi:putative zinc finger/helix-turn-helix YgiT family protein
MKQIKCRYCETGNMEEETYSQKIRSGRAAVFVGELSKWHCLNCGSEMTDAVQFERNMDLIENAQKKTTTFISLGMLREFRERYNLSQREASKLIGAGGGSFGKYESGQGISGPTAKLIRVGLKFPDVIHMLASEEGIVIEDQVAKESYLDDVLPFEKVLSTSSSWKRGEVPIPFHSSVAKQMKCGNDDAFMDKSSWANSLWEKKSFEAEAA